MGDGPGGDEFAAYATARWPTLVRTLVLLGATPERAATVARSTLAACAPGWERAAREGDVDARTYRTLLAAWARVPPEERDTEVPEPDPAHPDPERGRAALAAVLGVLSHWPDDARTVGVLHHVAGLDDLLADELAGPADARWRDLDPTTLAEALEAVPVPPAPVDEVVAEVAATRRRRRTVAVGVMAVVVVAAGVATWVGTRPPEPDEPLPQAVEAVNPADLPWYANGEVHVARALVRAVGVTALVSVPDGAVYADGDGRVVLADDDGELTVLGEHEPGEPLVAHPERGWVAWTEPTADGVDLVVWDTRTGSELARRVLDAAPGDTAADGVLPIALDQEFAYYRDRRGQWQWAVGEGGAEELGGPPLLDVASAIRAYDLGDGRVSALQPLFDSEIGVEGTGAELSPDGDVLLTRAGPGLDLIRLYETSGGARLDSGLRADDLPVAAGFGPDGTVSYIVAHRPNAPVGDQELRLSTTGPLLLRTCRVGEAFRPLTGPQCRSVTQFAANAAAPLLPQ